MLDGLVLLEFKNNLIVLFVEFFVNWNELDVFLCIWNGINCMLIGYVQNISLMKFGFEGLILLSLGKLKFMEKLDFFGNLLFGSIFIEFGNCSVFIIFYFYNNKNFFGLILFELGNFQVLIEVLLINNKFNGIIF